MLELFASKPELKNVAKSITGDVADESISFNIVGILEKIARGKDKLEPDSFKTNITEVGERYQTESLFGKGRLEDLTKILGKVLGFEVAIEYVKSKLGEGTRPAAIDTGVDSENELIIKEHALPLGAGDDSPEFKTALTTRAGEMTLPYGGLTSPAAAGRFDEIIKLIAQANENDWELILANLVNNSGRT